MTFFLNKLKIDEKSLNDSQSQAAEMSWVTMSDVKLQAVKGFKKLSWLSLENSF